MASGQYGWKSLPGIVFAVIGGLLAGGLITVLAIGKRRKYGVEGIECHTKFEFSGDRGASTTNTETLLLKARTGLPSFKYCLSNPDGDLASRTIKYRNLGKGGSRDDPVAPGFFTLGNQHIFEYMDSALGNLITIHPPAPIQKGEIIEIISIETATDCFGLDNEYVGKTIIFPIKKLRLS